MNNAVLIDMFAEDHAHEAFLRAVVRRLGRERQRCLRPPRVRNAKGGHGRVLTELKLYQKSVIKQMSDSYDSPDIIIVAIDANCQRFLQARQDIEKAIEPDFTHRTVIACPDPHIEKWYMADIVSFCQVVGRQPRPIRKKCGRDRYKSLLVETIRAAGHPSILGGIEFAEDLVDAMDFYRAGKNDPSLKSFFDELDGKMSLI